MISANGTVDNPDMATLEMISTARRGDDNFTLHLTNLAGFNNLQSLLTSFMAAHTASGLTYKVVFRNPAALSMKIDLLEAVTC